MSGRAGGHVGGALEETQARNARESRAVAYIQMPDASRTIRRRA